MNDKLLILDDDEAITTMLLEYFKEHYDVATFNDPLEALRYLRGNRVDVILTDVIMPNIDGIKILQMVKEESYDTDVIMMTAFANVENAVEAMKNGAYDYIVKPFKLTELSLRLKKVFEKRKLFGDNIALQKIVEDEYRPENMIGESEEMKKVFHLINVFSKSDISVLITGESGTGKELVAKDLHFSGSRKKNRFISVNCSAIPENLLESELFGFVRGTFTGAGTSKTGLFEHASGGTIFLDEIGDMPLSLQPKLLRVLEEKKIRKLGGTSEITIDIRLLCATNKDLPTLINKHQFREDLYYRINIASVHLPALREHKSDIPLYVSHFLKGRKKIHPVALRLLSRYSWPGNIRELKSLIEQLVIMLDTDVITPSDLPNEIITLSYLFDEESQSYTDAKKKLLDNFNREIVSHTLLKCHGNVTKAAKELSIDRGNLQKLMRKYKIISKEFKENREPDNPD